MCGDVSLLVRIREWLRTVCVCHVSLLVTVSKELHTLWCGDVSLLVTVNIVVT